MRSIDSKITFSLKHFYDERTVQEIVKANNMFLQSFEQRIAAMEQRIVAMEKNMVLEIPESEPYTPGAEENQM